jgi:hypothetical protein
MCCQAEKFDGTLDCESGVQPMKKDSQFTLRISAGLRKELQDIANGEGRSVAQICEAFLRAGSESYKFHGTKIIQKFLAHKK